MRSKFLVVAARVFVSGSVLWNTACSDIVVKVQRKPRDVDLSGLSNVQKSGAKEQNAGSSFFEDVDYDAIRLILADAIIRDLHDKGHRNYFRDKFRQLRGNIIAKMESSESSVPAFYSSDKQCQESELNFDAEASMAILGSIMKTGILSKLSKAETTTVNPALANNLEIIKDLIVAELGVKIDGEIHVEKPAGQVITYGKLSVAIVSDNSDTAETKEKDKGVIKIQFRREYQSTSNQNFIASIAVEFPDTVSNANNDHAAVLEVKRWTDSAGLLSHELNFKVGQGTPDVDGHIYYRIPSPDYSRKVLFEEIAGTSKKYAVTDVFYPYTPKQGTYKTEIDLANKKQCKVDIQPVPPPAPAPTPSPTPTPAPSPGGNTTVNNTVVVIVNSPGKGPSKDCACQTPTQQTTQKGPGQNSPAGTQSAGVLQVSPVSANHSSSGITEVLHAQEVAN